MDNEDLIRLLGKKHTISVLEITETPKSADEISDEADVPLGTVYRRIESLTEAGLLLHEDDVLTDDRRRKGVYRRNVEEITIDFSESPYSVTVTEASRVRNRLDEVWQSLSSDNGQLR